MITINMTDRQRTAIMHPCFEAEDTTHKRFAKREQIDPLRTSILTMNVGME